MAYNEQHLYMDDISEGQSWTSSGRTLSEKDIADFANLSGDFNPIHLDPEYARSTPFGKPIAHGLLGMAITSGLSVGCPPMRTLAFVGIRDWRFLEPIFIGDTVYVRTTVLEKEVRSRGRRAMITWLREVINQGSKVVQKGITMTLVEGKAMGKSPMEKSDVEN